MQKKLVRDERIMLDVPDHHESVLISPKNLRRCSIASVSDGAPHVRYADFHVAIHGAS